MQILASINYTLISQAEPDRVMNGVGYEGELRECGSSMFHGMEDQQFRLQYHEPAAIEH